MQNVLHGKMHITVMMVFLTILHCIFFASCVSDSAKYESEAEPAHSFFSRASNSAMEAIQAIHNREDTGYISSHLRLAQLTYSLGLKAYALAYKDSPQPPKGQEALHSMLAESKHTADSLMAVLTVMNQNNHTDTTTSLSLPSQWRYWNQQDQMGRGLSQFAQVQSMNTVNFAPPYDGEQYAMFTFRNSAKYGKDPYISLQRAQFLCDVVDGCRITVRFDDKKSFTVTGHKPADYSTNLLFLGSYSKLLNEAKKAKKMYIEADFYQEGSRIFEFDVSGLSF